MSKYVVEKEIFAEKVAKRPLPNNNKNKHNEKYPKTSRCAAVKIRHLANTTTQAQLIVVRQY